MCVFVCVYVSVRKKETETEIKTQTENALYYVFIWKHFWETVIHEFLTFLHIF